MKLWLISMNEPKSGYAAFIEDIKAALKSAFQAGAKNAEFVTQHVAGPFKGPEQFCARCGKVIAVIGESEPFSYPMGEAVFESFIDDIFFSEPGTLFRIPCQRDVLGYMSRDVAKETFVK